MKKYTFEFESDFGFDIKIPEDIKEDKEKVDSFVKNALEETDFGDFAYTGHSEPDVLQNPDGSSYAHTRVSCDYETTMIGRNFTECKAAAVSDYEAADHGNFKFDEVSEFRIKDMYEKAPDYITLNAIADSVIDQCKKSGERGYSGNTRIAAVNMDNTEYTIDLSVTDAVARTVDLKIYKADSNSVSDVYPLDEKAEMDLGAEVGTVCDVSLETANAIIEGIVSGEVDLSKGIENLSGINNESIINSLENLELGDSVIYLSESNPNIYEKMTKISDEDVKIDVYHSGKKVSEASPVYIGLDVSFKNIINGKDDTVQVSHKSPYEGRFDTTLRRSFLQETIETEIFNNWKDDFTVAVDSENSFKIFVDVMHNAFTAQKEEGRLYADGEDVIIGRSGHEPSSQNKTSDSIKEIVDFMCDGFYLARQGVRAYDENNKSSKKSNKEQKRVMEAE